MKDVLICMNGIFACIKHSFIIAAFDFRFNEGIIDGGIFLVLGGHYGKHENIIKVRKIAV